METIKISVIVPVYNVEKYCFDKRRKIINKENGGLSSARNKGMDIARGEYIYFIDSDVL